MRVEGVDVDVDMKMQARQAVQGGWMWDVAGRRCSGCSWACKRDRGRIVRGMTDL